MFTAESSAQTRAVLEAKLAELSEAIQGARRAHKELGEDRRTTHDFSDQPSLELVEDVCITNGNGYSATYREVQATLRRVEQGTFGTCLGCGEEVPPKRLKAVPWARFCFPCQQREETARSCPSLHLIF